MFNAQKGSLVISKGEEKPLNMIYFPVATAALVHQLAYYLIKEAVCKFLIMLFNQL